VPPVWHELSDEVIEHRIGDKRVLRHVMKWLNAGVLEEGTWRQASSANEGTATHEYAPRCAARGDLTRKLRS